MTLEEQRIEAVILGGALIAMVLIGILSRFVTWKRREVFSPISLITVLIAIVCEVSRRFESGISFAIAPILVLGAGVTFFIWLFGN
jgi:hypothetical protein